MNYDDVTRVYFQLSTASKSHRRIKPICSRYGILWACSLLRGLGWCLYDGTTVNIDCPVARRLFILLSCSLILMLFVICSLLYFGLTEVFDRANWSRLYMAYDARIGRRSEEGERTGGTEFQGQDSDDAHVRACTDAIHREAVFLFFFCVFVILKVGAF